MVRRWIIRSLFLLPLAFVVAVWVTSWFGLVDLTWCSNDHFYYCWALKGLGSVGVYRGSLPDSPIRFDFNPVMTLEDWLHVPTTLGFFCNSWKQFPESFGIIVPLWLPALLLGGVNWLVWRKTRGSYNGWAFPVELAKETNAGK